MEDGAVRQEVDRVEALLGRLEDLPDGEARTCALDAIGGLLRLYGEALRRIAAAVPEAPALRDDELVSHLLLLHGLHPATLDERVVAALDEVRPYMGSHGGGIELVEIAGDVARVRLQGTCSGCGASTVTLKLAVEDAVLRAAPELRAVEAVEGDVPSPVGAELPMVQAVPGAPAGRWVTAGAADELGGDGPMRREVGGSTLLFARAGDDLYAYVDRCPGCRAPLAEPRLEGEALRCGGCGRRYDVRRAGVGVDGGLLQLDPVPLLVDAGTVRVAVEAVPA